MQQSQPRGSQSSGNDNRNQSSGNDNRNQSRGRPGGGGHSGNRQGGGRSGPQRRPFRPPSSLANEVVNYSSRRVANLSKVVIFLLAVFGGGLLTIAGVFAIQLASGVEGVIWQQFALALGFAAGFFLVLASNSVLFTEANVVVPANLYNVSLGKGFLNLFLFWLLAWIGNYIGVILVVALLKFAGVTLEGATIMTTLVDKNLTPGTLGFFSLIVSGILANWVFGVTTMYSGYQRASFGKIVALFLAVSILLFTHLQLFPISMVILGLTTLGHEPTVSWLPTLVNHLIPVSIGNLIGAAFLVALPLVMQTARKVQRNA